MCSPLQPSASQARPLASPALTVEQELVQCRAELSAARADRHCLETFYHRLQAETHGPWSGSPLPAVFAYYRFRQINDNLIEAFIALVNQHEKESKLGAEQAVQRALGEATGNLQAAGQVLTLFVDPSIPSNTPFSLVKKKAFLLLEPARFPLVSDYMRNIKIDKTGFEWLHYAKLSRAIMRTFVRLRRLLATHEELARRLGDLEWRQSEQGQQIQAVFETIQQLIEAPDEDRKKRFGLPTSKGSPVVAE